RLIITEAGRAYLAVLRDDLDRIAVGTWLGGSSANRPRRLTSHLAAKSGDVLTVMTPEFWRCSRRSVPTAMRSRASRRTARYARRASVMMRRWRSRVNNVIPRWTCKALT